MPLLNLLSTLIYSLPSFSSTVLYESAEADNNSSVLVLLCDIIKQQLTVENHSDVTLPVAVEVLSLAESLCWRTPEDNVDKYVVIDFFDNSVHYIQAKRCCSQPGHSNYPSGSLAALLVFSACNPAIGSHVHSYGCLQL